MLTCLFQVIGFNSASRNFAVYIPFSYLPAAAPPPNLFNYLIPIVRRYYDCEHLCKLSSSRLRMILRPKLPLLGSSGLQSPSELLYHDELVGRTTTFEHLLYIYLSYGFMRSIDHPDNSLFHLYWFDFEPINFRSLT